MLMYKEGEPLRDLRSYYAKDGASQSVEVRRLMLVPCCCTCLLPNGAAATPAVAAAGAYAVATRCNCSCGVVEYLRPQQAPLLLSFVLHSARCMLHPSHSCMHHQLASL